MSRNVVGVGEVLWDLLPAGPQLGGAPANFAYHARMLGGHAAVVSRAGNDDLGRKITERFAAMGLPEGTLQCDLEAPTGTVSVQLDGHGVPQFIIHENVAWDRLGVTDASLAVVKTANAVCFGTLGQRSPVARESIQRLIAATPLQALRLFDINLRQHYYSRELIEQSLTLANVVKLNEDELATLAKMFDLGPSPAGQIENLAKAHALWVVALTRGPLGSLLFQGGRWSEEPPKSVKVVDTIGAGDAFAATLVMGLLMGADLDVVHSAAAEVARYVCTCAGATPPMPLHLRAMFDNFEAPPAVARSRSS